ncbi:MAG: hypothetical protein WCX64_03360 [Candidatus Micrarchaeia archaeon]
MNKDINRPRIGPKQVAVFYRKPRLMIGKIGVALNSRKVKTRFKKFNKFTHEVTETAKNFGYTAGIKGKTPLAIRLESKNPANTPFIPYKLLHALRKQAVASDIPVNVHLPEFSHATDGEACYGNGNGNGKAESKIRLIFPLNVRQPNGKPSEPIKLIKPERRLLQTASKYGLSFNNMGTPVEYHSKFHAFALSTKKNGVEEMCNNHFFDNVRMQNRWLDRGNDTSEKRETEIDFMSINHSLKTIHLYELYNHSIGNLDNKAKAWWLFGHNARKHGYVVEPVILIASNRKENETKKDAKKRIDETVVEAKRSVLQYFPHVEVRKISVPDVSLKK